MVEPMGFGKQVKPPIEEVEQVAKEGHRLISSMSLHQHVVTLDISSSDCSCNLCIPDHSGERRWIGSLDQRQGLGQPSKASRMYMSLLLISLQGEISDYFAARPDKCDALDRFQSGLTICLVLDGNFCKLAPCLVDISPSFIKAKIGPSPSQ